MAIFFAVEGSLPLLKVRFLLNTLLPPVAPVLPAEGPELRLLLWDNFPSSSSSSSSRLRFSERRSGGDACESRIFAFGVTGNADKVASCPMALESGGFGFSEPA